MNEFPSLQTPNAPPRRVSSRQRPRECGQLADAVEHFSGRELLEVLDYIDSCGSSWPSPVNFCGVTRGIHG
jgi:hypothetical protein